MTTKNLLPFYFLFTLIVQSLAQGENKLPTTKSEYETTYKWRIDQAHLSGQYIPKDLPDAITELNKLTDAASREKFKNLSEYDAEHKMYFSLNRWVCTNWGFYEGSRLSHYLKEVGITYPEDQATSIILAWHRSLNKKDINFRQIRDSIVEKRKREREERLRNGQVLKEETLKPKPATANKN